MTRPYPILRSDEGTVRLPIHLGSSHSVRPIRTDFRAIVKERILRAVRVLFPSLLALSLTAVAHAQGTMDFSGAQTLMGTFKTTLLRSVREAAEKRGYVVEGFAPTSRAANQLRDAGVSADTLQGFLARVRQPNPERHLYMVDESSLASTKQVRDFLTKLEPGDRVLLIGDTRQHQGVEAGKPFEQLVDAGMKTAQVDQIVRQRNAPELLKAVEHLSRGEIAEGVTLLEQQGRVTEIADGQQRIAAIAKSYAASPDNTIVVSPDNASRRQINHAVRSELQALGKVATEDHTMRVLAPRSDMSNIAASSAVSSSKPLGRPILVGFRLAVIAKYRSDFWNALFTNTTSRYICSISVSNTSEVSHECRSLSYTGGVFAIQITL